MQERLKVRCTIEIAGLPPKRDVGKEVGSKEYVLSQLRQFEGHKDHKTVTASVDARLRAIAERTGSQVLDPFPDVCGTGDGCSPLFGDGEPKFTDGAHLRPVFAREHLRFLDALLK